MGRVSLCVLITPLRTGMSVIGAALSARTPREPRRRPVAPGLRGTGPDRRTLLALQENHSGARTAPPPEHVLPCTASAPPRSALRPAPPSPCRSRPPRFGDDPCRHRHAPAPLMETPPQGRAKPHGPATGVARDLEAGGGRRRSRTIGARDVAVVRAPHRACQPKPECNDEQEAEQAKPHERQRTRGEVARAAIVRWCALRCRCCSAASEACFSDAALPAGDPLADLLRGSRSDRPQARRATRRRRSRRGVMTRPEPAPSGLARKSRGGPSTIGASCSWETNSATTRTRAGSPHRPRTARGPRRSFSGRRTPRWRGSDRWCIRAAGCSSAAGSGRWRGWRGRATVRSHG